MQLLGAEKEDIAVLQAIQELLPRRSGEVKIVSKNFSGFLRANKKKADVHIITPQILQPDDIKRINDWLKQKTIRDFDAFRFYTDKNEKEEYFLLYIGGSVGAQKINAMHLVLYAFSINAILVPLLYQDACLGEIENKRIIYLEIITEKKLEYKDADKIIETISTISQDIAAIFFTSLDSWKNLMEYVWSKNSGKLMKLDYASVYLKKLKWKEVAEKAKLLIEEVIGNKNKETIDWDNLLKHALDIWDKDNTESVGNYWKDSVQEGMGVYFRSGIRSIIENMIEKIIPMVKDTKNEIDWSEVESQAKAEVKKEVAYAAAWQTCTEEIRSNLVMIKKQRMEKVVKNILFAFAGTGLLLGAAYLYQNPEVAEKLQQRSLELYGQYMAPLFAAAREGFGGYASKFTEQIGFYWPFNR